MAESVAATGLKVQKWDSDFFLEYIQESLFAPYMGTSENDPFQVREDFKKGKGDNITFALVNRLGGAGVTGSAWLEGNEEDLSSRSFRLFVDKIRNAVLIPEMEEYRSAIDLRDAGRSVLKTWALEKTRDTSIAALGEVAGFGTSTGRTIETATAAENNAWLAANSDRVLFGAAVANHSSGVMATALATLDTTADKVTAERMSVLKRRVLTTASPKIRPIQVKGGKRVFVVFMHPLAFRDLRVDLAATNRDALERGLDNPIFTGADLYYDGMVFKQIDDHPLFEGVGASSADVAPVYMCGGQGVAMGWAQRTKTVTRGENGMVDYGDKYGMGVSEIRGIRKIVFGTAADTDTGTQKDNGIATGFFAVSADT